MLRLDLHSTRGSFELNIQTELSARGVTAVLGRNGSGKTSLLRAIAGLDPVTGSIHLNEATWLKSSSNVVVPTRKRKLGYVSQTPTLFPYLNVRQNLQFANQLANKRASSSSQETLSDLIERFELKLLLSRKPTTLSGGETSRVALARALISDPDLLLLDEPLSTIDLDRKRDLIPYLEGTLADLPLPVLYVTHDFTEVARLCTNAVVLREGKVLAKGSVVEVLHSISESDWPEQTTNSSIVNTTYKNFDDSLQLAYFTINDQKIVVPMLNPPNFEGTVPIRIQDRDVAIATTKPINTSMRNLLKCKILEINKSSDSPFGLVLLECGSESFHARITRASILELDLQKNSEVFALIKSVMLEA